MNIREIAPVIRTKNAGPYWFSADIIFDNPSFYLAVKEARIITREQVAKLYNIDEKNVSEVLYYDEGRAIKINIRRPYASGSPGCSDVLGMQQHAPLLKLNIPLHKLLKN
jgi:hypothetical protein